MGHLTEAEVAAFCSAWCDAEDSLKDVEGELLRLPQQPINELRYATRHFSRAVIETDASVCRQEYAAAMRHCVGAAYDTAEAVLVYRLLRWKQFKEAFADFPIETPVLNHAAAVKAYRAAQRVISRDPDARMQRRRQVLEASATLTEFDECLEDARDELNKKRKLRPQTEESTSRRWAITTGVGVCAIIFGGLAGVLLKSWIEHRADAQPRPAPNSSAPSSAPSETPPRSPP